MKLILSSCDFRNEKSKKTIIDNLSKPIDQCKLLFIPNEKATHEAIHSEKYFLRMQEFGFTKDNIAVFDYYNEQQFINLDLDIIYISGGNTFATLKRIKDCGFDKEIIRYVRSGVLYIGGSAGAHIATQSVAHIAAFDPIPDGMTDFKGLGLFDGIIFCHYTEEHKALYDKLKSEGKYKVFALRDEDSLVVASTNDDVIRHYDLMIDENNDPVHDPEPLREYMDKWYGQQFIDLLQLTKGKSVLEIGVGTGRLAVRVAPECREIFGIDLSPKTAERAKENLKKQTNVTLVCGDFMSYEFGRKFDVIYSSLTFMHIRDKQAAINKVRSLLNIGGRFVLSIDKNQSDTIDYGTRKIKIYPDNKEEIVKYITQSGMNLMKVFETDFAFVFIAEMKQNNS
jgi:peptidase E/2-polyprenyl-3-methyl-5-hydroxy-6-metoxy-1,4-benzoquinol methylase